VHSIELLETRRLLASFTASSVGDLVADINAANAAGGANTIALTPGTTFTLSAVNNETYGATGLPIIVAGNDLTIVGNGDTIQRSPVSGTPAFRLFNLLSFATLTLDHLTLSGGFSYGSGGYAGFGGAVANQGGTLVVRSCTIQNCTAQATSPQYAALGGGIYSGTGTLTVTDSAIRNNQVLGSAGVPFDSSYYSFGGMAEGGGVYVGSGGASLTNTTVASNVARGGNGADGYRQKGLGIVPGGHGGDALGGGIAGGGLTLHGCTVTGNTATGGAGGKSPGGNLPRGADGAGRGGGIYLSSGSPSGLDPFTQANTRTNTASTSDNDIFGAFTILP